VCGGNNSDAECGAAGADGAGAVVLAERSASVVVVNARPAHRRSGDGQGAGFFER
jgi:hypothetical protein